jgi:hypothetical protein
MPEPRDEQVAAFLVQYDPEVGEVQTYFNGMISEVIKVRQSMTEEVVRHAAAEELRKLGYTVIPPGTFAEGEDLVGYLQRRRSDTLRALRANGGNGSRIDYWRWQGHAELSRQLLERLGAEVPQ